MKSNTKNERHCSKTITSIPIKMLRYKDTIYYNNLFSKNNTIFDIRILISNEA